MKRTYQLVGGAHMNKIQATWFRGFVRIKVVGDYPERFFDLCVRNGIVVWRIQKVDQKSCLGNIFLKDAFKIKALKKKTHYKVFFSKKMGLPFIYHRVIGNKRMILGLIASLFLVLILSNMVWRIDIKGVRPELEKQIRTTLNENGVYIGKLKFSIRSVDEMQQLLLDEIPELLWVGVKEKGTTYALEGVTKTQVSKQEMSDAHDIVAAKNGVITKMYVSKGKPMVEINDYVKKGDLLVSGTLKSIDELEQEDIEKYQVAAEAEIIANTWYESSVNIALDADYQTLTGESNRKYYLNIGKLVIPIWGFFQEEFETEQMEAEKRSIDFFQWSLPIHVIKKDSYEKTSVKVQRTEEEATQVGIQQAKTTLQQQLGHKGEIIDEKILHETTENGKVKLRLYFTVQEDIAKIQDLSQGD